MDRIVLASNNAGKLAELQAMFAPLGIALVRQGELGVPEAPEPHRTFVENALEKARNAAAQSTPPASGVSDAASLPPSQYSPLLGTSSRPRMDSRPGISVPRAPKRITSRSE